MSLVIQDCLGKLPRTRKEAQRKGVLHYFTGKRCKYGHAAARFTSTRCCIQCNKTHSQQWTKLNSDKENAKTARRRAHKKNATPFWANQAEITRFYVKVKEFEQLTGIDHHVDHIYPLKSDFLCGLHVENNLQILTAEENIYKHNKMWPGQLPCQTGRGMDHDWWRKLNERIQSPSTSGGLSL